MSRSSGRLLPLTLTRLLRKLFVQQAGGEIAGHALDKAGKPHALVICSGSELFHKIVPLLDERQALSVFASEIHLSQRERQCISRVQYMLTESHKGLSL